MKKTINNFFKISFTIVLLYGCNFSSPDESIDLAETPNTLSIPAGFDFSTHQKVTINIIENEDYAKYDVYIYSDESTDNEPITEPDDSDKLIFTGVPSNGVLKQTINLPKYHSKVYIRRSENSNISSAIKEIVNQEVNFNSSEAKSATKSTSNKKIASTDTDGDGIIDEDDAYPNDPKIAFEYFTPSKYGKGTIAFEDSWPSTGDYDFNDVAFNYSATVFLNADNLAVGFDFEYRIISNRAGNINGIGFQIDGLAPSKIESVKGTRLKYNFIKLNPNGTEANQENAVIILTDAVRYLRNNGFGTDTISVKFVNPISTSELGVAPFNHFLILNLNDNKVDHPKVREREIHLPYMNTTSLGSASIGTVNLDGTYISQSGYPWALSIIEGRLPIRGSRPANPYFRIPKDTINITAAYNFFQTWAESGGSEFKYWYSNGRGYRNIGLLQQ